MFHWCFGELERRKQRSEQKEEKKRVKCEYIFAKFSKPVLILGIFNCFFFGANFPRQKVQPCKNLCFWKSGRK